MSFEDDVADLGSMFDIEFDLSEPEDTIAITSGQRQWVSTLDKLSDIYGLMINAIERDIGDAAKLIFSDITSILIGTVRDRLPKDTGRLRAEFERVVEIKFTTPIGRKRAEFIDPNFLARQGKIRLGDTNIIAEMTIDIGRLLTAVPYAKYHIEELILKDTYDNPTIKGTQPLDLTLLAQGIRDRMDKRLSPLIEAKGWDVLPTLEITRQALTDESLGLGG